RRIFRSRPGPVSEIDGKPGKDEAADDVAERHRNLIPQPPVPVGIMNMLTTACSKPCAKKMKIGIQAVAILPIVEFVLIASTTARQTIQLHRMPLTNAVTSPATPNAA